MIVLALYTIYKVFFNIAIYFFIIRLLFRGYKHDKTHSKTRKNYQIKRWKMRVVLKASYTKNK